MPRDTDVQRRLAISRVAINKQDPELRKKNFDEVAVITDNFVTTV